MRKARQSQRILDSSFVQPTWRAPNLSSEFLSLCAQRRPASHLGEERSVGGSSQTSSLTLLPFLLKLNSLLRPLRRQPFFFWSATGRALSRQPSASGAPRHDQPTIRRNLPMPSSARPRHVTVRAVTSAQTCSTNATRREWKQKHKAFASAMLRHEARRLPRN